MNTIPPVSETESKTDWSIPKTRLIGKEETPGVFSAPTSEVYTKPTVDGHAAIVDLLAATRSLPTDDKEALAWALMCAQDIVDKWPTMTLRTLGSMSKSIEVLKDALSKVNLDK